MLYELFKCEEFSLQVIDEWVLLMAYVIHLSLTTVPSTHMIFIHVTSQFIHSFHETMCAQLLLHLNENPNQGRIFRAKCELSVEK